MYYMDMPSFIFLLTVYFWISENHLLVHLRVCRSCIMLIQLIRLRETLPVEANPKQANA